MYPRTHAAALAPSPTCSPQADCFRLPLSLSAVTPAPCSPPPVPAVHFPLHPGAAAGAPKASKKRKQVDRRASKGRKLRYHVQVGGGIVLQRAMSLRYDCCAFGICMFRGSCTWSSRVGAR